jgi:hypothetical protein
VPTFHYNDELHEYSLIHDSGRIEILPSVTRIIEYHGFINEYSKNQDAALRGSMAHLAAQYIFQQRLDWGTVDPTLLGYCQSLELWIKATGFVGVNVECRLYHSTLKFAGTYDVKGHMPDGSWWIIDLKTGVAARWHEWQTSAYLILDGGYARRGSLYLRRSGKIANFKEHDDPKDEERFISLLNVMRMKEGK